MKIILPNLTLSGTRAMFPEFRYAPEFKFRTFRGLANCLFTVAWLTLFRRGSLYMTQPVQLAFLYEAKQRPKIFLRTLLYATGKRGYVIEGLFLKVHHKEATQTFAFWAYGERNALTVAGGLRVTEESVSHNHHFLQINEHWYFADGDYEIYVYARIVNRKSPKLLGKVRVALSNDEATSLYVRQAGVTVYVEPGHRRV
jgi:hypothetical protein